MSVDDVVIYVAGTIAAVASILVNLKWAGVV